MSQYGDALGEGRARLPHGCYSGAMRFGTHSHDVDPQQLDAKDTAERDRLVRTLRDLAERIERANLTRVRDSLRWIAAAVDPVVRSVERALGQSE